MIITDLLTLCHRGLTLAERLADASLSALRKCLAADDSPKDRALVRYQAALHGCAWLATYVQALREMLDWANRLDASGGLREFESLLLQAAFGEYLAQLRGGLAMSQGEIFRIESLSGESMQNMTTVDSDPVTAALDAFASDPAVVTLTRQGFAPRVRERLAML